LVARRPAWKLLAVAGLFAAIVLTHSIWLGWLGDFLTVEQEPVRADLVVVLAGDAYGHRILKGAELVKRGFAPLVLVSGPPGYYDLHENELAIPFAVRRGYPVQYFIPFPNDAHSTIEEAAALLPELERRRARRVIVVTSDFHSRRALRTLRARWNGIDIRMVPATDEFFTPHGWWHSREGRKTFLLEWTKTFASLVGM
jgi:uncharacterized SAM-binding protein YcdF (DUF218 family)